MSDPEASEWDAIVVGAGMGGGTLGYALAKAGRRVLFLEKGRSHLGRSDALSGKYAELFFPTIERPEPKHADLLRRAGRWSELIVDASGPSPQPQIPFVGSGSGGSSALFGMAMERFWPADFQAWPFPYEELKPFYEQAERMYRVRGTADPLRQEAMETYLAPPPLAPANAEMVGFLSGKGLHPYQLPVACDFAPGCQNCQGFLCPKDCRNDSAKICVGPALRDHGAHLLDECDVVKVDAQAGVAAGVTCTREGKTLTLRAKVVVLAAGAIQTPALLLRSGLANRSQQVGRNLMRHYIDLYAVKVRTKPGPDDNLKQIAFNDLHHGSDGKLGTVQSFGKLPPPSMQSATIHRRLKHSPLPFLAPCFSLFRPLAEWMLSGVFSGRLPLASIMEDFASPGNEVTLSAAGEPTITYRIPETEQKRIDRFRERIADALSPNSFLRIKQAQSNARIAHVCGTCRAGTDPQTSVVDAANRTHEIPNLYVVDASFFPSSGGTNPALTIAANALRVAAHLLR